MFDNSLLNFVSSAREVVPCFNQRTDCRTSTAMEIHVQRDGRIGADFVLRILQYRLKRRDEGLGVASDVKHSRDGGKSHLPIGISEIVQEQGQGRLRGFADRS